MPATLRNVAKTDTLETQRQKINQIAQDVYTISSGGSDLSAGNIRLGDGTRTSPSLSFNSDNTLGIYKSEAKTIGYVSDGRKVADFAPTGFYSFRDLVVQRKILITEGTSVLNYGSNYDPGSYINVPLLGGTGEQAEASIVVTEFNGTINNDGRNYNEGSYVNVELQGGSGSGAVISFDVDGIDGNISDPGSGYIPGIYSDVPLSGGSGTGATANVTITGSSSITGTISGGSGYTVGFYGFISLINQATDTYAVTTIANPGTPPPNNVYQIDGNIQQALTLVKGNTYRFDLSDASNTGHPLVFQTTSGGLLSSTHYATLSKGTPGTAGAFVDLIIKPSAPSETIKYNCSSHDGMGANITVTSGVTGQYGSGLVANITVSFGSVSSVIVSIAGSGYKENDILSAALVDVGGTGSGFTYTLDAPSYDGIVSDVEITDNGINYEIEDILEISDLDVGGGGGSGFLYTVSSNPGIIDNLVFSDKGNGYEVEDVLTLPQTVSGIQTTLKGLKSNVSATLTSGSAILTLASTVGIVSGMLVSNSQGDIGTLPPDTIVQSVDSSTQITLSNSALTSGASILSFASSIPRNTISVSSTDGIFIGFIVSVTSGTGVLVENTTVSNVDSLTNIIGLSSEPTTAGEVTLEFIPPYGEGTSSFEYEIDVLGAVESYSITSGGNGYSELDQLTVDPTNLTQPIVYDVKNESIQTITFDSVLPASTFSIGDVLKKRDANVGNFSETSAPTIQQTAVGPKSTTLSSSSAQITVDSTTGIIQGMIVSQDLQVDFGVLVSGTTVLSIDSSTELTLSDIPVSSGAAGLTFSSDESGTYTDIASSTDGSGLNATFDIVRNSSGLITSIIINDRGYFYEVGDTITIDGSLIGGSSTTHDIILEVISILTSDDLPIYKIRTSSGNIVSIDLKANSIVSGDVLIESGTTSPFYTVDVADNLKYAFLIDSGNGFEFIPDLTLYAGNTYSFDTSDSSLASHNFSLSKYPGGIWGRSLIENISVTLDTNLTQITIPSTTNISPGMLVTTESGSIGSLVNGTTVESVDSSTTLTLSNAPLTSGSATLIFRGVEYTDNVTRTSSSLSIKITDTTPNLYYYCSIQNDLHSDEGGIENEEGVLTVDQNNPKTFGSGFILSAAVVSSSDVFSCDIETGLLSSLSFSTSTANIDDLTISEELTAPTIIGSNLTVSSILSNSNLSISAQNINATANLNIGSNIQIVNSSGNITTSGILKTTNSLNINDRLSIINNTISSASGNNIILSPATGRVAKVNTTSAITIPSGTTAQRPSSGIVESGSIRFNTDTGQYEGYSAATSSWSSLGGVRDLDGNTYIAAEASIGANDNTLYFYNDGNNTINITPNEFTFNTVKNIDSPNPLNPVSVEWSANTPVDIGDYLYYGLNVYEVTGAGTTGTSGNEPTHTTGTLSNGSAQLTWYAEYASDITFDKVANVNINTNLVFNDELKLFDNKITTLLSDIVIEPFAGKKVDINTNTSLVLPNGTTAERGIPGQGSVRFNTSLSQFEGYNGVNWTSLGGVRDVDGNTYIIPETSPGSNENILYFFNDGDNTLRLSTTELTFDTIDQIGSTSGNLDLQAQTVTFNSLALTIDTSVSTDTTLLSTQDNFNIALSSGLTTDPLLRLTNTGEIYINQTFGTGSNSLLKVLDKNLNKFELDDVITETSEYILTKGTTDSGASVIFDPTLHSGAKVIIIADNTTADDREMIEFTVIAKGTDIFHTEYGNVVSGDDIISPSFDFDAGGNVRLNAFLASNVAENDVVNITVVSTVIKR